MVCTLAFTLYSMRHHRARRPTPGVQQLGTPKGPLVSANRLVINYSSRSQKQLQCAVCSAPQIHRATSNAVHAGDIKTSLKCLAPLQFAFLELKKVTCPDPAGSAALSLGTVFPEGRGTRPTDQLPVGERQCRNRESSGLSDASQAALMVDG